ncbi:MAG: hypothetical protein AAFQ94_11750 [Bacteroidota bacterium]
MQEIITISRNKPALKSMDFQFLREEGIRRIQELAGDIWTDYNSHDPGVTLLEALCYAITDLGYRTSFDMKDLLAANPDDQVSDFYDFFTARQILHNNPLTIQDYRKMLMDVSIQISGEGFEDEIIGVKNAWIEVSEKAEFDLYVYRDENYLDYVAPKINSEDPLDLKVLYDVVLEFSDSKNFGDLNSDTLEDNFAAFHPNVVALFRGIAHEETGLMLFDDHLYERLKKMSPSDLENAGNQVNSVLDAIIKVKVEFPRWDQTDLDWNNITAIKSAIRKVTLSFFNMPDDLGIIYKLDEDNNILLASEQKAGLKAKPVPFIDDITNRINCLVLGKLDSLIVTYQQKVLNILTILDKAKARLNANRNLCEDFYSFNALRVEEILICADMEVEPNANISEVEGQIFFALDNFLSPTVNFYSLDEILEKDLTEKKYNRFSVDKENNRITVFSPIRQSLVTGTVLSLSGFGAEIVVVTISTITENILNDQYTDIVVNEDLSALTQAEDSFLFVGRIEESQLRPVEEVFDGPPLENGFIDDNELQFADRQKYIQASDIINLIMDIPGVTAVRTLQLANFPQDENPEVASRSVRWCLELATDKNYVPRISLSRSKLTYFKDNLPYQAGTLLVEEAFNTLKDNQRPQKPGNAKLDFEVPRGEYRDLADYVSVQDDLPLTYGVGKDGVPVDFNDKEQINIRKSKAKQLKGYLMVFDQLLANYLAQLDRMKDLFSFNPDRKSTVDGGDVLPEDYNFQVNKTYFSQPLFDMVADSEPLYANFDQLLSADENRQTHADNLQKILENKDAFVTRRNKFLDHLIARFGVQFNDYTLLTARISDPSASDKDLELIEDKQDFLNMYPDISMNRGKAFNYKNADFWHLDNVSGLEKRVAFLSGIDPAEVDDLYFNPKFVQFHLSGDFYKVSFSDDKGVFLNGTFEFRSLNDAKLAVEKLILNGVCKSNFVSDCQKVAGKKKYNLYLMVDDQVMAVSPVLFDSEVAAEEARQKSVEAFKNEFFENPLSSRKNFSLPFNNYFESEITDADIDIANESYVIKFRLYAEPYQFDDDHLLLSGVYSGQIETRDIDSIDEIKAAATKKVREQFWQTVYLGREACQYTLSNGNLAIIDRLAEEVATGDVDKINKVLADINADVFEKTEFEIAVERLNAFFERNFFRQEGFHLLEHILLRPKVNNVWVPAKGDFIREIPENDSIIPLEKSIDTTVKVKSGKICLKGDQTRQLRFNQQITLTGNNVSESFKIDAFEFNGSETIITTFKTISEDLATAESLAVSVLIEVRIIAINEEALTLTLVDETPASLFANVQSVNLRGSRNKKDYGEYTISKVEEIDGNVILTLDQFKIRDQLLPIYLPNPEGDIEGGEACKSCQIDNPYSYIAQVVVSGWPGRLDNIDFRSFFEKTIRMEAPAQLFLNICWVGYDQMEDFEYRYKNWLLENLKEFPVKPYDDSDKERLTNLSRAKQALIDILFELRNVYPVRTLHDCGEDESTDGAIILNQTALGEI